MCRSRLFFFLACVLPTCAHSRLSAAALPVTVLLDFEQSHSPASLAALRSELTRILASARLTIDLRLKTEVASSTQFGELVIFKMRGSCTMNALPIGALSDERGALAMTYTVDGQLLPFGEVECDRVRQAMQKVLGRGNPEEHQAAFGIALARVMAHEMYHMLGRSAAHTKDGVTKETLSGRELAQGVLPFSKDATHAIRARSAQTHAP